MNKNNTYKEIWNVLNGNETVLLFPHILVDGDAIGSSVALCEALRKEGTETFVVLEEELPQNIKFLNDEYIINYKDFRKDDGKDIITALIDCGDHSRIPNRIELFQKGKHKIVIDHHFTSDHIGEYNYIDSDIAATGEIIFEMLEANNVTLNEKAAIAIYTAITTDTGNFLNANTDKRSHEIMAKLYDIRDSYRDIAVSINENTPYKVLKLKGRLIEDVEICCDGKMALLQITKKLLSEMNCTIEDVESTSNLLRSIEGVEVAIVLKEVEDGVKVSMRAKSYFDVAQIAEENGGGGHIKAAGFTSNKTISEVADSIKKEIELKFVG